MTDPGTRLRELLRELKRRRVFRVAVVYLIVAWAVVQVADAVTAPLYLPDWTETLVLVLMGLGFPVALVLAWAFDVTPEGVERAEPVAADGSSPGAHDGAAPNVAGGRRWTAQRIAVAGAVAVLALAGAAMLVPWDAELTTVTRRVAVLPFEDRTSGDPELAVLGLVAADYIADGLTALDTVQAIAAAEVRQVLDRAGDEDLLRSVARETRAGLAVVGSYLLVGDSVEVRAQLVDPVDGTGLTSFGPVRAPRSDPVTALVPIRQQVMSAVAIRVHGNATEFTANLARPPSYEAYRMFLIGVELFHSGRYREAIPQLWRAHEADSTFWQPVLWVTTALGNTGQHAWRDSILQLVDAHRAELSELERIWVDWGQASLRGDLLGGYRLARRAYDRAPGSVSRYLTALYALRTNRPREAVVLLGEEPRSSSYRRGWYGFHATYANALHLVGEHEVEQTVAREAETLFPDHPGPVYQRAQALIGLGRPEEAARLAAELRLRASSPRSASSYARRIGDVLAAHGYPERADTVYRRAIELFEAEGPAESPAEKDGYAGLLRRVGRLDEAARLIAEARAGEPEDRDIYALEGIIAAQRGDRAKAERVAAELAARDDPYDFGGNTYNRACIRARLGDLARAVELLGQAHTQGAALGIWVRIDPDLRPLDGYPPFEELIQLKG